MRDRIGTFLAVMLARAAAHDASKLVCDWMAAAERHPEDGVRLDINVARYGIAPQLEAIIANTLARWPRG